MDKDSLQNLIDCGYSQRELALHFETSQGNIKYWLNKFVLSTNHKIKTALPDRKICSKCKVEKPNSEFYKRNDRSYGLTSMCKTCNQTDRVERQHNFKQQCVDYKGGECQCCGYNDCNSALDFHHVDPKTKKFGIGKCRKTKMTQKILDELDKCILVCSNCHREIHAGYRDITKENISNLQSL